MTPELQAILVQIVVDTVADTVASRKAGHCIRIGKLPRPLAAAACEELQSIVHQPNVIRLVTSSPDAEWEVTPTRAVSLRNEEESATSRGAEAGVGVLVLFLPAGSRLSVEDSIGSSTFETLDFDHLGARAREAAVDRLMVSNPEAAESARNVAEQLRTDPRYRCDELAVAGYLLSVANSKGEIAAGTELPSVGLIPDRELPTLSPDEVRRRLQVNNQMMLALEKNESPAERLRNLPIDHGNPESRGLVKALGAAIGDGTIDRRQIAERLQASAKEADLSSWVPEGDDVVIKRFEIAGLLGEFAMDGPEPTVRAAEPSIGVRFICDPAPAAIPAAHYLRLEILEVGSDSEDVHETGFQATKSALPRITAPRWQKKFAIRDPEKGLSPGLYRFRLTLVTRDNVDVAYAMSEVFRIGDDLDQKIAAPDPVLGIRDAQIKAIEAGVDPIAAHNPIVQKGEKDADSFTVRFEGVGRAWSVTTPETLTRFEASLINDPGSRGLRIGMGVGGEENLLEDETPLPEAFVKAREHVFQALREHQRIPCGDQPSVALADLEQCSAAIESYVKTWISELGTADAVTARALLCTDQVHVYEGSSLAGIMVAPTHPLRICWLAESDSVLTEWVNHAADLGDEDRAQESEELSALLDQITPLNVPPILVEDGAAFRATESLTREWALWCPAANSDRMALTSRVRSWLGLPSWRFGRAGESELLGRVRAYIDSHPYVRRLVMNVVQPGEAELLLRILGQLEADPKYDGMSFILRLFGETEDVTLGRALDAFMLDPEESKAVNRQAAESLTRTSADPLTPKLAYSKHELSALLESPSTFNAHISLFIDFFKANVATLPQPMEGTSFFAGGLLIEPQQRYIDGDDQRAPQWVNYISMDQERGLLAEAFRMSQNATARQLSGEGIDPVPTLQLEMDPVSQAVLDAVHRSSDWVVIIDPVFSDEFLDAPPAQGSSPTYVIDMQSGATRPGGRNVVVSSRIRQEQVSPLLEAARKLNIEIPEQQSAKLMEELRLLGAGVGLRLMMDERRAKEALSLALASLHLKVTGIMRHALVIPVDLHQELFAEGRARGVSSSISRTDLAIFQLDPVERSITVRLVEVKVRSSLTANGGVSEQLASDIHLQLSNTEDILLSRLFGAQLRQQGSSLSAAIQLRRLTVLLRRYLSRASRQGLVVDTEAEQMSEFIESLHKKYSVGSSLHGLIFHADSAEITVTDREGVELTVVGRDYIHDLIAVPDRAKTVFFENDRKGYLRSVFRSVSDWKGVPTRDEEDPLEESPDEGLDPTEQEGVEEIVEDGPDLTEVDLLGAVPESKQFGIIGRNFSTNKPVAVDMWGTNVISVFGVQGSGKSYTVGNLLEAGLIQENGLNRLPAPLGGVVFHYSSDQTYAPEFAAMSEENADGSEALAELGGRPLGLRDLMILVPAAVLEERQAEYRDIPVRPILLGPDELQLADWKLLMGIAEGTQMYAKTMSLILGDLRGRVTVQDLRDAVTASTLTPAQKTTALNRISFVEPYVRGGEAISQVVQPGRLVIVDLRDELMDKGEALSLFMVLLNRFTQARHNGKSFNKIIVFDEAHKYMDDPALTNAITEAVREMRHKGASIVVASQNPPSVPEEIIELSSIILAHKFTSPAWLKHLQKVSQAFVDMKSSQFTHLGPGQAFAWAAGNPKYARPQRIQMRPRLTRHGGATRRATG